MAWCPELMGRMFEAPDALLAMAEQNSKHRRLEVSMLEVAAVPVDPITLYTLYPGTVVILSSGLVPHNGTPIVLVKFTVGYEDTYCSVPLTALTAALAASRELLQFSSFPSARSAALSIDPSLWYSHHLQSSFFLLSTPTCTRDNTRKIAPRLAFCSPSFRRPIVS